MNKRAIIKYCKELGCCDACCIRYLGHRNPGAFENTHEFLKKLLEPEGDQSTELNPIEETSTDVTTKKLSEIDTENGENKKENCKSATNIEINADIITKEENNASLNDGTVIDVKIKKDIENGEEVEKNGAEECKIAHNDSENEGTPAKRAKRSDVCFSCIGILQEESWPLAVRTAQAEMEAKGYECTMFACALSGPISTALREKVVSLRLKEQFPEYELPLTPLKEAWKWSFCGPHLAVRLGLRLESGAVAELLLTFYMDYKYDMEELRSLSPALSARRITNRRELDACLSSLRAVSFRVEPPREPVVCLRVQAAHEPAYIGGRYIKLSRSLPQTPWIVQGARMLPSSVQEVIFGPVAALYRIPPGEVDRRLKLLSAGREDVDVRCLGRGRPFAVEISSHSDVKVNQLKVVKKAQLQDLKKGEESKLKSYEALCIKLTHTDDDIAKGASPSSPPVVSPEDIARINALTPPALELNQRTPLRVLHRRPLHTRCRRLLDVRADPVPDHAQLVRVRLVAQAGTYIKEWVHGEVGRTTPSLRDVVPLDILALDVTDVHLDWPPT